MPFKSKAQMYKFGHLLDEGKISKATFDEWHGATKDKKSLPERVGPKTGKVKNLGDVYAHRKKVFGF